MAARQAPVPVPPGVQALMDALVEAPAVVQNGRLDILGGNALGRALYAPVFERAGDAPPNLARFLFLDERAGETFPEREDAADVAVALLQVAAARSPCSRAVTGLVGELATRSTEFRTRWAAHDIRAHRRGSKRFRHPAVGDLTLDFEALEIAGGDGLTLFGYTALPDTPAREALRLLASWAATEQRAPGAPGVSAAAER
ncbi:hypothetical protein [Streptomyces sp. AM6-12]|uniref:MmyB family transcriptional regulator n=1 Tax=Streptomyces sp. AM6-12 TaxID=3345149 RepID=UPI0037BCF4FF